MLSTQKWAEEEFGDLECRDVRHGRRLVRLASDVAARPAGTVTGSCSTPATREGAFRLIENPAVGPAAIRRCVQRATLARCPQGARMIVAIDGTSLNITDNAKKKGLGGIGSWERGARGLQVMSALAITESGQPIGILSQETWVRSTRTRRDEARRGRPRRGGESKHWVTVLDECRNAFDASRSETTPWFQIDRGGDCWHVLDYAEQNGVLITVRAVHDRRIDGEADKLWQKLMTAPIRARLSIEVAARPPRLRNKRIGGRRRKAIKVPAQDARRAKVVVRATNVPIIVSTPDGKTVAQFSAVLVREVSRAKEPVEWLLLTTHPIATRKNVLAVVRAYALRWRIEDFHRAWKTGLCRVEDTQLRSRAAIEKWATILASVATRAMRLAHQARIAPDAPATSELTPVELDALIALRQPNVVCDRMPTLGEAVRWLAELGGYTGPWNGPPGATVIGRGLHDLLVVARAFQNRDRAQRSSKKIR